MVVAEFEMIDKEQVAALSFPPAEVLTGTAKLAERMMNLQRALSLGNLEHSKIKIYFEDGESCKVVETTVWGVTDKRVILKQGIVIPIHRIHSVNV